MKLVALIAGLLSTSWSTPLARSPDPAAAPIAEPAPATAGDQPNTTIPKEQWASFLAQAAPRFVPLQHNGQIVALRVFIVHSSLRELGLKGGEYVTAINDHALRGDNEAVATFMHELEASRETCSLSLTVQDDLSLQDEAPSRTIRAAMAPSLRC